MKNFRMPLRFYSWCSTRGAHGNLARKSDLTSLLSTICSELYGLTPVINNEVINKEEPTTVATNSRNKLIAGLLRTELEPNLGLSGSGQDVSIMRSTVLNTGIVVSRLYFMGYIFR